MTKASVTKTKQSSLSPWWGEISLPIGEQFSLFFDGLDFAISHHPSEWQVQYMRTPLEETNSWSKKQSKITSSNRFEEGTTERFIYSLEETSLSILPRMGDRPFVVKPHKPLTILGKQTSTIYVTTAVWLSVAVGKKKHSSLTSLAIQQPSDTWMGGNTITGQLCYASRTAGRLSKDLLPQRPFRAFTQVVVKNATDSPLKLEKFIIPAPNLSIFKDEKNALWTETVTLERSDEGADATIKVDKAPPKELGKTELISPPVEALKGATLVSRFSHIFG